MKEKKIQKIQTKPAKKNKTKTNQKNREKKEGRNLFYYIFMQFLLCQIGLLLLRYKSKPQSISMSKYCPLKF